MNTLVEICNRYDWMAPQVQMTTTHFLCVFWSWHRVQGGLKFPIQDDRRPKSRFLFKCPSVAVLNSLVLNILGVKSLHIFPSIQLPAIRRIASSHQFQSKFHEFEPCGIMDWGAADGFGSCLAIFTLEMAQMPKGRFVKGPISTQYLGTVPCAFQLLYSNQD